MDRFPFLTRGMPRVGDNQNTPRDYDLENDDVAILPKRRKLSLSTVFGRSHGTFIEACAEPQHILTT